MSVVSVVIFIRVIKLVSINGVVGVHPPEALPLLPQLLADLFVCIQLVSSEWLGLIIKGLQPVTKLGVAGSFLGG